jgi:hypothetical protein
VDREGRVSTMVNVDVPQIELWRRVEWGFVFVFSSTCTSGHFDARVHSRANKSTTARELPETTYYFFHIAIVLG